MAIRLLHQVLGVRRVARHAQRGRVHLVQVAEGVPLEALTAGVLRLLGRDAEGLLADSLGEIRSHKLLTCGLGSPGVILGPGDRTHLLGVARPTHDDPARNGGYRARALLAPDGPITQ